MTTVVTDSTFLIFRLEALLFEKNYLTRPHKSSQICTL